MTNVLELFRLLLFVLCINSFLSFHLPEDFFFSSKTSVISVSLQGCSYRSSVFPDIHLFCTSQPEKFSCNFTLNISFLKSHLTVHSSLVKSLWSLRVLCRLFIFRETGLRQAERHRTGEEQSEKHGCTKEKKNLKIQKFTSGNQTLRRGHYAVKLSLLLSNAGQSQCDNVI